MPFETDAVLFDLDCTLVDRRASIRRYMEEHFLPQFGSQIDDDAETTLAILLEADGTGYRAASRPVDIVDRLTWRGSVPTAGAVDGHWREHFPSCAVAASGALDLLQQLKDEGVPLGLITNGSSQSQRCKVEDLEIGGYFSAIAISEEVGSKKPDPRIFQTALESMNAEAARSWYVGDHPTNDVLGAAAVGMRSVWVSGWHPWPADTPSPTHSISELGELIDVLALGRTSAGS